MNSENYFNLHLQDIHSKEAKKQVIMKELGLHHPKKQLQSRIKNNIYGVGSQL